MTSWPPSSYFSDAKSCGISSDVAREAIAQAHAVQENGYAAILTLGHLAFNTETSVHYLREIVGRMHDPYRVFSIHKRSGGKRHICVAEPDLARVQKWLHRYVLHVTRPNPASFAYTPGSSPLKCAKQHSPCQWLIKIDIRQFFESISEIQVYRVFRELGYTSLVAFELARLTTRVTCSEGRYKREPWQRHCKSESKISAYHDTRIGYLPQGASTSPMLANLAMQWIDNEITGLAESYCLTYTRYSDDLAFSTIAEDFSRDKAKQFIHRVYELISKKGLRPNTAKTVIVPPGSRKIILGLLVNTPTPKLTKEFRSKLECHTYYLEKLGPTIHAEKRGFRTVLGLRRHIEGLVSYATSIDRDFGDVIAGRIAKVAWPL